MHEGRLIIKVEDNEFSIKRAYKVGQLKQKKEDFSRL